MSQPSFEKWPISSLATPYYGYANPAKPICLVIPKYQRTYVWGAEKRRELIDSLKRGYPIGTLLVRATGKKEMLPSKDNPNVRIECDQYELIDGLQRSTSLVLHNLHSLYSTTSDVVRDACRRHGPDLSRLEEFLTSEGETLKPGAVVDEIVAWLRDDTHLDLEFNNPDKDEKAKYKVKVFAPGRCSENRLVERLMNFVNLSDGARQDFREEFGEYWRPMIEDVKESLEVGHISIPVIIWEGNAEDAASVFIRVNRGGKPLDKYDVLGARWTSRETDVSDSIVRTRARNILYPQDGQAVIRRVGESNVAPDLFEAMIGLSDYLVDSHPLLFEDKRPKRKKKSSEDLPDDAGEFKQNPSKCAFNIAAIACQTKLTESEMIKLPNNLEKLCDLNEGKLPVQRLVTAIIEAANIVSKSLPALKYASKENGSVIAHKENAMAAMIGRYAAELLTNPSRKNELEATARKVLPGHYLVDLIVGLADPGSQSHADDVFAFGRVWKAVGEARNQTLELNDHYVTEVGVTRFDEVLNTFWQTQSAKYVDPGKLGRPQIDSRQKTLLKFVAARTAPGAMNPEEYHIDHSVPLARVLSFVKSTGEEYHVGSMANLAIIPKAVNLGKGKDTLDEWLMKKGNKAKVDEDMLWKIVPYKPGDLKLPSEGPMSSAAFHSLLRDVQATMTGLLRKYAKGI